MVRVKNKLSDYVFFGGKHPYFYKEESTVAEHEKQDQKDLKELRNKFLHWSADRDWVGIDPEDDGKRDHIHR